MRTSGDEVASDRASSMFVAWRRRRLLCAGFDPRLAAKLASNLSTDLHAVLELVDRGCPPRLAARILAPLEHPPLDDATSVRPERGDSGA